MSAGTALGAPAPASSRTRRLHGDFPLGDARIIVASSRQQTGDGLGVLIGAGTWRSSEALVTARCTPHQARVMARALLEAADVFEAGQRHPQFMRGEVRHG